jgi:hypothetical protein
VVIGSVEEGATATSGAASTVVVAVLEVVRVPGFELDEGRRRGRRSRSFEVERGAPEATDMRILVRHRVPHRPVTQPRAAVGTRRA